MDKHSSLFGPAVSDEEKKFYNIDPRGVEESKILVEELGKTFLKLIYEWDTNPRCQFHQHFMSSFCAKILSPKNYKPKL